MVGNDAILAKVRDPDILDLTLKEIPVTPRKRPVDPYIPDKSQKRELSVGSTPSPSSLVQVDKKQKGNNQEFDWPDMEPAVVPTEVTLVDIMAQ